MPTKSFQDDINYQTFRTTLQSASNDAELFSLIVNTPFTQYKLQTTFLFLGIIVLLLVDEDKTYIKRIALSNTELAQRTKDVSVMKFEDIKVNLKDPDNIISAAVEHQIMYDTTDWKNLFSPSLTPAQARINQSNAGIAYSAVYPLKARNGGAIIPEFRN